MTKELNKFLLECTEYGNVRDEEKDNILYLPICSSVDHVKEVACESLSLSMAIAIKDQVVETLRELKERYDGLSEIEIQNTIEYTIISAYTKIPLKDISPDEYFKYRMFMPYETLRLYDPNILLIENTIKRIVSEEFMKKDDIMSILTNKATQEMFTELQSSAESPLL